MGKYRVGHVIKMTRKALSITQEQLSEEICSVETLSRVENGRQNPSRDIYELLMERMGRSRERSYSMMSISDYQIFDKIKSFDNNIESYNYNEAEQVLNELRRKMGNSNLDRQFLLRADIIINFRQNRINAREFLLGLEEAIRLTIPQYGKKNLLSWPVNYHEAALILNISSAYAQNKNYHKAIDFLEESIVTLNQSYMNIEQKALLHVTFLNNLSKWYGILANHEKAIEVANEGIELCKKNSLCNIIPNLLYSISWNKEHQISIGVLPINEKRECIRLLKKSYYLACAVNQINVGKFILEHIYRNYPLDEFSDILF